MSIFGSHKVHALAYFFVYVRVSINRKESILVEQYWLNTDGRIDSRFLSYLGESKIIFTVFLAIWKMFIFDGISMDVYVKFALITKIIMLPSKQAEFIYSDIKLYDLVQKKKEK